MKNQKKKLRTFVVDVATWCRGSRGSSLLVPHGRAKGKMCCLGHVAAACGIKKECLLDRSMPKNLDDHSTDTWTKGTGVSINHEILTDMARTNDTLGMPVKRRQELLQKHALNLGWNLQFK